MYVVVANRHDEVAARLVARWVGQQGCDAVLLTPVDLSQPGWRFQPDAPGEAFAMLGGRPVPAWEVSGVLARMSRVLPQDLPHIAPVDRDYVAQEMTAFLLAWLTSLASLGCPVLNRPTPACLAGPAWRQERWLVTASRRGIPVVRLQRDVIGSEKPAARPAGSRAAAHPGVLVVGESAFGSCDDRLGRYAVDLAQTAGCALLAVSFDTPGPDGRLSGVDLWPDLTSPSLADAVLAWFDRPRTSSGARAWDRSPRLVEAGDASEPIGRHGRSRRRQEALR